MPSVRGDALQPLLDAIQAAPACPDGWSDLLAAIGRAIGAAAAGIVALDLPEGRARVLHGPPGLPDPPPALARPDAPGRGQPLLAEVQGHALHLVIARDAHRVAILVAAREPADGAFPEASVPLLRRLAPALGQALALAEARAGEERLRRALDAVAGAILFAGPEAQVMHANRAGLTMLAAGVPLHLAGGRLAAAGAEATVALRAAIRAAAEGRTDGGLVPVPLPGSVAPVAVHLLPLGGAAGGAAAALFLPDPAADPASGLPGLVAAYRLTGAEAALLAQLLRGATLADAASALHVAPSTARTHLAHLFAKTGTARQAELVALAARLTAPVRG